MGVLKYKSSFAAHEFSSTECCTCISYSFVVKLSVCMFMPPLANQMSFQSVFGSSILWQIFSRGLLWHQFGDNFTAKANNCRIWPQIVNSDSERPLYRFERTIADSLVGSIKPLAWDHFASHAILKCK